MPDKSQISRQIKEQAILLGLDACGFSKAEFLEKEAPRFKNWLSQNMHGEMHYMENHFEKRMNPKLLHEGTKSVISVLLNYYPKTLLPEKDNYKISKYAYGKDYHFILKEKLHLLLNKIEELAGRPVNARLFVDSAPVLDRAWAARSGLGWIGKNSCLIRKNEGSFFFIGEILCDLELEYDEDNHKDFCGNCTKCIDACPTGAITSPQNVDAQKCISYLTIEYKNELPNDLKKKIGDWIFGCDICQDVCPHNRFAKPTKENEFSPKAELLKMNKKDWGNLSEEKFRKLFKGSPLERCKYNGLKRNINFLQE